MIQELIFVGYKGLWTDKTQYQYLFATLLPRDKELMASILNFGYPNFCWVLYFFLNAYRRREIRIWAIIRNLVTFDPVFS